MSPESYILRDQIDGKEACVMLVDTSGTFLDGTAVLGESFLRNFYLVLDATNR